MIEPVPLTLGAAAVMGLSFGAGPCSITCLPYLGPVFLTEQRRWRIITLFSAGRLAGYALLGTLAGFLGQTLDAFLDGAWGGWVLGIATLLMGVVLWRKAYAPTCHAKSHNEQPIDFAAPIARQDTAHTPLFFMGMGLALNPCTPLSALLLAAAATQSALLGGSLGIAFGLGAVLVPALLFGLLVAHFGHEVRQQLVRWQPLLIRGASVMLIMLGIATLTGWVTA